MRYLNLNRAIARLILLQRIELASPTLKKIRKIFGRYIFTNFVTKFLISPDDINLKYYSLMIEEYKKLQVLQNLKIKKFYQLDLVCVV